LHHVSAGDSVNDKVASDDPYRLDLDVLPGKEEHVRHSTQFSVGLDGANRVSPSGLEQAARGSTT
jgi:hypothetical protein